MNSTKNYFKLFSLTLFIVYMLVANVLYPQTRPPYASDQPISSPRIFEIPGINVIWHITFSTDGLTFYIAVDTLKYSNFIDGHWSTPKAADFIPFNYIETPFISPDGNKFFIAKMDTAQGNDDIYVMDKTSTGWSVPRKMGEPINSNFFEGMATSAANGNLYFLSNRDGANQIYCSKMSGNNYSQPQIIDGIFNKYIALSPFIAQDESYLLFVNNLRGSTGDGDIFISFYKNGLWSIPRNLGTRINAASFYDDRPFISPDGNYLFFLSSRAPNVRNVYQVDWKPTLESLREIANWNRAYSSSNQSAIYIPEFALDSDTRTRWISQNNDNQWFMVKMDSISTINKVVLQWGSAYGRQYEIQTSSDSLTWQTVFTENNGNGSTDSISFEPVTARYVRMNGIQRSANLGYSIYEFKIFKTRVTGVSESKELPKGFSLNQNYPNPFNPETVISYQLPVTSLVQLKVFDMLGREITTLINKEQAAGNYEVKFDGTNLPSGIYLYKMRTSVPLGNAGNFIQTKKMFLIK